MINVDLGEKKEVFSDGVLNESIVNERIRSLKNSGFPLGAVVLELFFKDKSSDRQRANNELELVPLILFIL